MSICICDSEKEYVFKQIDIDLTCPICLNKTDENNIHETECGHIFCNKCIFEWVQKTNNCPMCRHKLDEQIYEEMIDIAYDIKKIDNEIDNATDNEIDNDWPNFSKNNTFSQKDFIHISAQSYNVLRVISGMGCLRYTT
jgi:hypothetical protein